jgi:type IV secretory pathway VirB10-like protein
MGTRYSAPKKKPKTPAKAPAKKAPKSKAPTAPAPAAEAAPSAPDDQALWRALSAKQQRYCTEYMRTGDAVTAQQVAYGNDPNAMRSINNPKVQACLKAGMAKALDSLQVTNDWIVNQFVSAAIAEDAPWAARLRALENLAELRSMFPPKQVKHTEDDPLVAALREALDGIPAGEQAAAAVKHVRPN